MPRFRILPQPLQRITVYVISVFNHSIKDWIFIQAFYQKAA